MYRFTARAKLEHSCNTSPSGGQKLKWAIWVLTKQRLRYWGTFFLGWEFFYNLAISQFQELLASCHVKVEWSICVLLSSKWIEDEVHENVLLSTMIKDRWFNKRFAKTGKKWKGMSLWKRLNFKPVNAGSKTLRRGSGCVINLSIHTCAYVHG